MRPTLYSQFFVVFQPNQIVNLARNRTISLPFDFSGQQNSHQNQSDLSHIPSEIKIACGLGQSLDLASKA